MIARHSDAAGSTAALERGREAYARRAWDEAATELERADAVAPLWAEDLERRAIACYLSGRDLESTDAWTRAHQAYVEAGRPEAAVRCAFWLAFGLMWRGEHARASGWLARASRLLDECGRDCVERGYLGFTQAVQAIFAGDNATARDRFEDCIRIATRFDDADLAALARHGKGRALIRLGSVADGVALLDEAMAAVEAGVVSPVAAGDVYCGVIEGCHEILDLRRAAEWTAALSHWCEGQPELVPYRGECLVRRAEILRFHGEWHDAMVEAQRACERLSEPPRAAVGAAHYQRAELHRLRGELEDAEAAYAEARAWSRKPWPGPALLCLDRGDAGAALASIRSLLHERAESDVRAAVLAAAVEIFIAAADLEAAGEAAGELATLASRFASPLPRALAARAQGAIALAREDAEGALDALRRAWAAWQELDAPYEGARTRVLIGRALAALGDRAGAQLELRAARRVFEDLHAAPAAAACHRLLRGSADPPGGLTSREVDVLRLVAAGLTNRVIGERLFISEKTVARHVANIFAKLELSSRAAATAWAIRQGIA